MSAVAVVGGCQVSAAAMLGVLQLYTYSLFYSTALKPTTIPPHICMWLMSLLSERVSMAAVLGGGE